MKSKQYKALADLYHAYFTGGLLCVALRKGPEAVGEVTFNIFRRQHHEKFLSSFEKLGLQGLPDAVACAQYHYLSNGVGGVGVEYMYESDTKAWVHFCHPRWIYDGTALCGMPEEVSLGFLKGWYAYNGVSLNNPRLGFVCTCQDMDGAYGFAGYFKEYDHDLSDDERLQFAPDEIAPPFDSDQAPKLDTSTWSEERLEKANRNYAMEYVKNFLIELANVFDTDTASELGTIAAKQIGAQFYEETRSALGLSGSTATDFATYMQTIIEAHDEEAVVEATDPNAVIASEARQSSNPNDFVQEDNSNGEAAKVRLDSWRLFRGVDNPPSSAFPAWNGLFEGALAVHNRQLILESTKRLDRGDDCFEWHIRPRACD
jgi:hypothetical protein